MTWYECKWIALQKMFAAGRDIQTDETTQDYLAAMPGAANEAIHRILAVRPLRGSVEVDAPAGREQGFDLRDYAPDYKNSGPLEVYRLEEDGLPRRLGGCRITAGQYLFVPPLSKPATLLLCYDRRPARLTADTPDSFRLPLDEDAAALLPLYMAGELYKEDDMAAATYYMNEFEVGLASLVPRDTGVLADAFSSESGW